MKFNKTICGTIFVFLLTACSTVTPVNINTELVDRLPEEVAIAYLDKQKDDFGTSRYGQCIFKHGDVRIVLDTGILKTVWEWVNTYEYEEMTLHVLDNPLAGRSYTLKGNNILIGSPGTYNEGKQCDVMAGKSKESSKYPDITDDVFASKIVSSLQSIGVKYNPE